MFDKIKYLWANSEPSTSAELTGADLLSRRVAQTLNADGLIKRTLNLSSEGLDHLAPEIANLTNLHTLRLADNRLRHYPQR